MSEVEEKDVRSKNPSDEANSDNEEKHIKPKPDCDEISLFRESMFLLCMCLQQLLTQSSVAQTTNPTSEIGATFGVQDNPGEMSWFTSAFSFSVGTFILISGRLGDIYGYKKIYLLGMAWISVFSLLCGVTGFTTSAVFLDVMRAMQGLGFALSMPNALALIGHYYPNGFKKSCCMCLYGSVAPGGFVFGALFSGLCAQFANNMALSGVWLSFFLMSIAAAIVFVMAYFAIPENIENPQGEGGHNFDILGGVTGVAALSLINFAWNQGPNVGWDKPYVYVLLIVGVLLLGVFYIVEKRVKDPLLPTTVLTGETGFVLGCVGAGYSCFGVWLYYSFRWAEFVDHEKPLLRAVQFIPALIIGFLAASLTAVLLRRFPLSFVMILAMLAFFTGITIMGTRHVGQIYWAQKFVSILIQCFGMDMSFPAGAVILSHTFPKAQQGIAASLVATFQNFSISIGLGLAGTVEKYETMNRPKGLDTTVHGYRVAFYMGMGLAGLGVVLSFVFFLTQVFQKKKPSEIENPTDPTEEKLV